MHQIKHLRLLLEIDWYVRSGNTGGPDHFAKKLRISPRHLYFVLAQYKEIGIPLNYDRKHKTYYYTESVSIDIKAELKIGDGSAIKILNLLDHY